MEWGVGGGIYLRKKKNNVKRIPEIQEGKRDKKVVRGIMHLSKSQ